MTTTDTSIPPASAYDGPKVECHNCGQQRPSESLVCPLCGVLSFAELLTRQSAVARGLEAQGRIPEAINVWTSLLPLLPEETVQARWIRDHLQAIDDQLNPKPVVAKPQPAWVKRLGPLAPVALFLLKAKSLIFVLFKLKFLLSFGVFLWFYCVLFGWQFGLGFALSILIHEMGHFVVARAKGLQVEMPNFLPGFGAWVSWRGTARVTLKDIAWIGIAGPIAGLMVAALCVGLYWKTGNQLWAALAYTTGWLNVLNLTPVWIFDGGFAIRVLRKPERMGILLLACVLFYLVQNPMFLLVAAGAGFKMFTRDEPEQGSYSLAFAYVAVLAALGWVLANMNVVKQATDSF